MNNILTKEENELTSVHDLPAVSIVLPFTPKMFLKQETEHRLKMVVTKVSKLLRTGYPIEKALFVIDKLNQLIKELNFDTHKKSIAIFVSSTVEKVFYLDALLEERIVINESFQLRDLVYNHKHIIQYLILLLSEDNSSMFLGTNSSLTPIKSNLPNNAHAYTRDLPGKTTNFSDTHEQNEILLDKFMHHMDEGLSFILKTHPLPVFVMGPTRVIGHFKAITKNDRSIVHYINRGVHEVNEKLLLEVMQPHLSDWQKIKEQMILNKIDKARGMNKLVTGIKDVWSEVSRMHGKLLIVEKDYNWAAGLPGLNDKNRTKSEKDHRPFYIKDGVDDIIEKIFESGGDVEFVENDVLAGIGHIALIKFY